MSVSVQNLTKNYSGQLAVNNVSFDIKPGEIVGFLGPNGAGKTTTMKILTCFIPQTSGEVSVCGHDVVKEPLAVRKLIGYLPEHNPLYKEMYVKEYLNFVAGLYKIKNKKKRVAELIEMTGLGKEQHKHIAALSKGYRQRVGLAQSMLHDPKVLILDEPTSGLDPNQLVEIRSLIKEFGKEKTVIFSTHIMQEVQAICDRVLIINSGKLVADDNINALTSKVAKGRCFMVELKNASDIKLLEKLEFIESVQALPKNKFKLFTNTNKDIREDIFNIVIHNKAVLLELTEDVSTVEDAFQKLTK